MKIGLISGHGAGDSGALGCGLEEATETIKITEAIKRELESMGAEVKLYPTDRNAYRDCLSCGLVTDFSDCNYVLEIHLNSGRSDETGDDSVGGTEIYITEREETHGLEDRILNSVESIGFKNRGVKIGDFLVINKIKNLGVSSALLEAYFIDDKDDVELFERVQDEFCYCVAKQIFETYSEGLTEPKERKNDYTAAIQAAYACILHRQPDPNGLQNYLSLTADCANELEAFSKICGNLVLSDEYRMTGINALYNTYLGREADVSGYENYSNYDLVFTCANIQQSEEYLNK